MPWPCSGAPCSNAVHSACSWACGWAMSKGFRSHLECWRHWASFKKLSTWASLRAVCPRLWTYLQLPMVGAGNTLNSHQICWQVCTSFRLSLQSLWHWAELMRSIIRNEWLAHASCIHDRPAHSGRLASQSTLHSNTLLPTICGSEGQR